MNSTPVFKYIVYDLRTYFSQQPGHIKRCPVCGKSIMVTSIHPSKAVVRDLSFGSLIPVHDFSCLYGCSACHWWAARESWGFRETSSEMDFLVVGEIDNERTPDRQSTPWREISQLEDLYNHVEPLPDHLGQLFVGGQRKR
jgi:hypothetical protein